MLVTCDVFITVVTQAVTVPSDILNSVVSLFRTLLRFIRSCGHAAASTSVDEGKGKIKL